MKESCCTCITRLKREGSVHRNSPSLSALPVLYPSLHRRTLLEFSLIPSSIEGSVALYLVHTSNSVCLNSSFVLLDHTHAHKCACVCIYVRPPSTCCTHLVLMCMVMNIVDVLCILQTFRLSIFLFFSSSFSLQVMDKCRFSAVASL